MTRVLLHHVQVSCPEGGEDAARRFYGGVLGLPEVEKPPALAARGGCWFRDEGVEVHVGVEPGFAPARKAHPAFLVQDADGRDRFLKYLPRDRSFVNTIENYPYPYVIGRLCWQFPCMTPSDWQAQHLHKPNNPLTVRDWQAALDCTVLKQGVFCLVFHPHGWIQSEQIVDLIDHATFNPMVQEGGGLFLPAYKNVWTDDILKIDPNFAALKEIIFNPNAYTGTASPAEPNAAIDGVLPASIPSQMMANVINGSMSAEDAVKDAHDRIVEIFEEAGLPQA